MRSPVLHAITGIIFLLLSSVSSSGGLASGLPVSLTEGFFYRILIETPQGNQLARRLLGQELERVTGKEFGRVLETLALPKNSALSEELATRVKVLETAASRSPEALQAALEKELALIASPGGTLRFASGEVFVVVPPDHGAAIAARAKFMESHRLNIERLRSAYTWDRLDLRAGVKDGLQRLKNARQNLLTDRLIMRQDGSEGAIERLIQAAKAFVRAAQAASEFSATLKGPLTKDEARIFMSEVDAIRELTVTAEFETFLAAQQHPRPEDELLLSSLRRAEKSLDL